MNDVAPLIVLLTDFGRQDHYVGVMKGVIHSLHPTARIVDLSHDVLPQDVAAAGFLLASSFRFFPRGTIFVSVVDPGVGSSREILCVKTREHLFLAPDNGLLTFLKRSGAIEQIYAVTNERLFLSPVSATFHGRDIFAPVAAHLSMGLDLFHLGAKRETITELPTAATRRGARGQGTVVLVDHFGNLITDIPATEIPEGRFSLRVGRKTVNTLSPAYASGKQGSLIALIGSSGTLELSVVGGSAARTTGLKAGAPITLGKAPVRRGRKSLVSPL